MGWIPVVLSIFGAIQGYQAGKVQEEAGKAEERLAEQNALFAKQELQETVRRQEAEDARLESKASARLAASGARFSGTASAYMGYLEEEHGRQLDWTKTSGASAIRLQLSGDRLRAKATQTAGKTKAYSSLFTGLSSGFAYGDKAGLFG